MLPAGAVHGDLLFSRWAFGFAACGFPRLFPVPVHSEKVRCRFGVSGEPYFPMVLLLRSAARADIELVAWYSVSVGVTGLSRTFPVPR